MYKKIEICRICGNKNLPVILDLGEQALTGVFPKNRNEKITSGPLHLVKCMEENGGCGLVQLEHSYDFGELYGDNYGYRSGLNASMVTHLQNKVQKILKLVDISEGDLVIDIGSNDSTTLKAYPQNLATLVGIDPTGVKFHHYYPAHVQLIPDFFSSGLIKQKFPDKKARVITSFSMFYDLEAPLEFMKQIEEILAPDGIWVFEQSYMPTMLEMNSYDTVCHEHLEFYALAQIEWMAKKSGLKIIDLEMNAVNGGSFSVTVTKINNNRNVSAIVAEILEEEKNQKLHTLAPYEKFASRTLETKRELLNFIKSVREAGKTISAIGASTKGNVLLQYCGLTEKDIPYVGEVNKEKFGCYTPGTQIPIISEDEVLAMKPDYLLVLPWHFRDFFLKSQKYKGFNLVFPLPKVEIVTVK